MDSAVETVLREYEARADAESKRMRELGPEELARHLDELLLAVGPATGQLINILASEAEARVILEIVGSGVEVSRYTRGLEVR